MTFEQFIATTAGADWIASTEFDRACVELFQRLERGEAMMMQAAANAVRMPFQAFTEMFGEYLRAEAAYRQLQVEAKGATRH